MRVAFFGSPEFAVPSLRRVAERHAVVRVYTQPDRPAGRGRATAPPAVKSAALALGLPVAQPESIKTAAFREAFAADGADVGVVAAYGEILGPKLLALAPRGFWNVHASLLPRWRGASPIQWAILSGDTATGVSLMRMTEGLDEGPVLSAAGVAITDDADAETLGATLAERGAALLAGALDRVAAGGAEAALVTQDPAHVTWAPLLKKEDGRIAWTATARAVHDRVRAFHAWPGAFTTWRGQPLKVVRTTAPLPGAAPVSDAAADPGTVVGASDGAGLWVQCGDRALELLCVQRPGKDPLDARAFLRGARLASGERLGA